MDSVRQALGALAIKKAADNIALPFSVLNQLRLEALEVANMLVSFDHKKYEGLKNSVFALQTSMKKKLRNKCTCKRPGGAGAARANEGPTLEQAETTVAAAKARANEDAEADAHSTSKKQRLSPALPEVPRRQLSETEKKQLLEAYARFKAPFAERPEEVHIRELLYYLHHPDFDLLSGEKDENRKYVDAVVSKLDDAAALRESGVTIGSVLSASTYYEGLVLEEEDGPPCGRHALEVPWKVNATVVNALHKAYLSLIEKPVPTGKRYCAIVDQRRRPRPFRYYVHARRPTPSQWLVMCCKVLIDTEEHVECIGGEHRAVPLPFTRDMTVYNMLKQYDLARPLPEHVELAEVIDWALEKRKHFDEFIVFAESRNGCWTHEHYRSHPTKEMQSTWAVLFKSLDRYRNEMNLPNTRLVVVHQNNPRVTHVSLHHIGEMIEMNSTNASLPGALLRFLLEDHKPAYLLPALLDGLSEYNLLHGPSEWDSHDLNITEADKDERE